MTLKVVPPSNELPLPPPVPQATITTRVGIPEAMVSIFGVLAFALSARLLLLLSLCGAFVLSIMAMNSQSYTSVGILVAYCFLTVIPLAYLELKRA